MAKLTATLVARARSGSAAPGRYIAGPLILNVGANSASWTMRYQHQGRRHDLGLGSLRFVGLGKARELVAAKLGTLKGDRLDPMADRQEARAEQSRAAMTFDEAARQFIDAHAAGWRDPRGRVTWESTLSTYASPFIGKLAVADITTAHLLNVLQPIWHRVPETASRVRGRIEQVLDWAKAHDFRDGENVARWKGHLALMLPAKGKVKPTTHHPAVPLDRLPAVFGKLGQQDTVGAVAVQFAILTAARAREATGARWSEIDLATKTWTIPGPRMKSGREHRVPLCPQAVDLLRSMAKLRRRGDDRVFPGATKGSSVSTSTLSKALRDAGSGAGTLHGMRSAFDDWAHERTSFPPALVDRALAHVVGGRTVQAYRRSDLLEARRELMAAWASFVVHNVRRPRAER